MTTKTNNDISVCLYLDNIEALERYDDNNKKLVGCNVIIIEDSIPLKDQSLSIHDLDFATIFVVLLVWIILLLVLQY
jgi:hypothetical protein